MKTTNTEIKDCFIIEPTVFGDDRGWFMESYNEEKISQLTNVKFIQDNHSFSAQVGTFRGMHAQYEPFAQVKLVRCTAGGIIDYVYDARKDSPTFGKKVAVELSAQNKLQLLIPAGCLHGFETIKENTEVQYKVDKLYSPSHDVSVSASDIGIKSENDLETMVLSAKDKNAVTIADYIAKAEEK